jgi:hypothetical protein
MHIGWKLPVSILRSDGTRCHIRYSILEQRYIIRCPDQIDLTDRSSGLAHFTSDVSMTVICRCSGVNDITRCPNRINLTDLGPQLEVWTCPMTHCVSEISEFRGSHLDIFWDFPGPSAGPPDTFRTLGNVSEVCPRKRALCPSCCPSQAL